jgi:hypothetical protein
VEAAKLEPCLEKKAVAGGRPGEKGDALVRGIFALQEEKGGGVPFPGKSFQDSGTVQPGADFLRIVAAEEKVSGVLARQLEEEFTFRRGCAGTLPCGAKQRERE